MCPPVRIPWCKLRHPDSSCALRFHIAHCRSFWRPPAALSVAPHWLGFSLSRLCEPSEAGVSLHLSAVMTKGTFNLYPFVNPYQGLRPRAGGSPLSFRKPLGFTTLRGSSGFRSFQWLMMEPFCTFLINVFCTNLY